MATDHGIFLQVQKPLQIVSICTMVPTMSFCNCVDMSMDLKNHYVLLNLLKKDAYMISVHKHSYGRSAD